MSTAAEHDHPYDDDADGGSYPDPDLVYDLPVCCHDRDCRCGEGPARPPAALDPDLGELLQGPAADALFGLDIIRDAPTTQVPPAVMVQAVLGAQRLISWARAQQHRWTAALARPGVAVPVSDLLDSVAHRNEEGQGGEIAEDLAERAAAGTEVAGDPVWDALLAAQAASMAEPELSAAWLVAPITARRRIADAQELVEELPDTFAALEDGRIEEVRARIIAETTAALDPQGRRRAETLILDRAKAGLCPGDLRRLATRIVADIDPEAANRRAEQARARRGTGVRDLGDDLGRFTADLAVEDAALTQAVLDLLAKAIPPEARRGRGVSQLRADIFADLFGELADTGLIDLRGINPTSDTDTGPDPDPTHPFGADTAAAPTTDRDSTQADGETDVSVADPAPNTASDMTDTATDADDRGTRVCGPSDTASGEPAEAAGDTAGSSPGSTDTAIGDAHVGRDDADAAGSDTAQPDPATADGDTERSAGQPDVGEPGQPPWDDSTEPEPEPDDPDQSDAGTGDSRPGDSGPANPDRGDTAAHPAGPGTAAPTAAELLARLRSIDWESRLDPDCERRGGLLSMIRLPAGVRVNLDVTVALSTLAGYDDLSARLSGLGVITADTARALAKAAGTVRILLTNDPPRPPNGSPPGSGAEARDPGEPREPRRNNGGIHHDSPDCGTVLDFGRTAYRPPASVIDRVDTRDQRCRFPGCPQVALRCDHDHRITWDDGGATCPCDLDALCRFHHRIKTFTAWAAVRDHSTNTLTWTSPLGRTHADRPAPDLPTGTRINLSDTGSGCPGDSTPATGHAGPDLAAKGDPPPADMEEQGTDFGADCDPDEPPF